MCLYTNIQEFALKENLLIISPNPTENNFTIKLNAEVINARVDIYKPLGEKVYSTTITSKQQTINKKFPQGIYFVKVTDGSKQITKKLIVQ